MQMYRQFMDDPIPFVPEYNDGKDAVERSGYLPPQRQIESMIMAGERLNQSRAEMFDFPDGKEVEDYYDPTREPGFDMADASALARDVKSRLVEQKRAAEEAAKEVKDESGSEKDADQQAD